jgi:hypothetical protein
LLAEVVVLLVAAVQVEYEPSRVKRLVRVHTWLSLVVVAQVSVPTFPRQQMKPHFRATAATAILRSSKI